MCILGDECFLTKPFSRGWRLVCTHSSVLGKEAHPLRCFVRYRVSDYENEFLNIVSISFTALVLNELIMVALEITIWYDTSSGSIGTVH